MFSTFLFSLATIATSIIALPTSLNYTSPEPQAVNSLANNMTIIQQLELAPTAAVRLKLIQQASDWIYDFNNPPSNAVTTGAGGHTVRSDRLVFPPTIGTGVSMTVGFIGPCGFNTPHTHPRSSEINIVVQGRLGTEFTAENGVLPIYNELDQYQMTIFPQGAMHAEFNPDCEPAVFVAAFASEDPGVQQAAQTFFGLDSDIVQAALNVDTINGADIEQFKGMIPPNVALGVDACLRKCNMTRK
jgi:oxalate decarboxylase/phosphoglucose isomerase-like protein (cupin superfamily)